MVKDQANSNGSHRFERQAIKDWPVSERPREKLLHLGPEGLSDGELLAVLLRIGKAGQSAEDLPRQLMSLFNGISGFALKHHEKNRLIFLFEPQKRNEKVPFDLTTFKYVPISEAAEIPDKMKSEIIAILRDAGAPL